MSQALTFRKFPAVLLALAVCAGVAMLYKVKPRAHARCAAHADCIATQSLDPAQQVGKSGLPIPRFVSLKTDKVNVRKGPGSDRDVAWIYSRKGLPVEIVAEFEGWRRVRDSDGAEGWVLHNMLAGKRTALVAPARPGTYVNLMRGPSLESGSAARIASGVVGEIKSCDGTWCRVAVSGFDGYLDQNLVWGAYPGELVN